MAKCGIKEYDELPARVALIDVDFHRAALASVENTEGLYGILKRIQWGLIYHTMSLEKIKQDAIENLEEAWEIHHGKKNPFYAKFVRKDGDLQ